MSRIRLLSLGVIALGFCVQSLAQKDCPLPPSIEGVSSSDNMFSDEQEVFLGDAMAETVALHFNVIQDDELTGHLREIGNRLVRHLPPTRLDFRFYLIDMPEVNAFSIAGGRVYISRKIVAFARNDDELAGVLAHELGHIVTHQSAIEMTREFRDVIGVTHIGARDDVVQKYHLYLENIARSRGRRHRASNNKYQEIADQVSIYTLARAGFDPSAMPEFWDRFTELHGKSGNWLSDLFGTTTPEQHRMREMAKNMSVLPHGCMEKPAPDSDERFREWQSTVIEYIETRPESLPGLVSRSRLSQRLRPEITNLRFSQDGNYILAQDDGGIHVLSRAPFQALFYIPAPDASDAKFSPDSSSVNFVASGLRVERWNIAQRTRERVRELTLHDNCIQAELSPDGNTLACLGGDSALLLVDVNNSTVISRRDHFYNPSLYEALNFVLRIMAANAGGEDNSFQGRLQLVNLQFSPDGRYLLAASGVPHTQIDFFYGAYATSSSTFLFDLKNKSEANLPGSIKKVIGLAFAFVGSDEIAGVNSDAPQKSAVLKFPSGEKVREVPLAAGITIRGATQGNFLVVGPLKQYPLGVMDLNSGKIIIGLAEKTADVYGQLSVIEQLNGELALHSLQSNAPLAVTEIPESNLGRVRVAAVSPELNYLAVSTRTRAAIWDLQKDTRAFHARAFDGATFEGPNVYADFPKYYEKPRSIAQIKIDSGTASAVRELQDPISTQHEKYLLKTRFGKKGNAYGVEVDIQVEDVVTGQPLWVRHFRSMPRIQFSPRNATVLMSWPVWSPGAQEEMKRFFTGERPDKDDLFCEVADANLGALAATFVFRTNHGSVRMLAADASRSWAVFEANGNQILTFSLPDGRERGHFFGTQPVLSPSGMLAVNSGRQEISIYDLSSSDLLRHYAFASPVEFKAFAQDGSRLLVFTSDQTVYIFDVTAGTSESQNSVGVN